MSSRPMKSEKYQTYGRSKHSMVFSLLSIDTVCATDEISITAPVIHPWGTQV